MGSSAPFDSQPEFQRFKSVMKRVVVVSKAELEERILESKEHSPRKGNPSAPGRKKAKK